MNAAPCWVTGRLRRSAPGAESCCRAGVVGEKRTFIKQVRLGGHGMPCLAKSTTVGHTGAHTERNRKQFRTGTPAPRRLLDGVGSAGHIRPKGPASGVAVMGQAKPMTAIVIASIRKAVNNGDPKECKPIQVLHPVSVRVRSQVCVLGVKSPCLGENETGEQAACKAQAAQIRECILQKDGEENG